MKEDWEREHLKDQIYIKEAEWMEIEYFYEQQKQKPAKIKLLLEKNPRYEKIQTQTKRNYRNIRR